MATLALHAVTDKLMCSRVSTFSSVTPHHPAAANRASLPLAIYVRTASLADRLGAMRGPGESYSDVIMRMVELKAQA
jgi:hypothetical protein